MRNLHFFFDMRTFRFEKPDMKTDQNFRTLERIQAIQMTAFYYRPAIHSIHISLLQLINLSVSLAKDLCIDKYLSPISTNASIVHEGVAPADAWRTVSINPSPVSSF